jgi:hypothetical protein
MRKSSPTSGKIEGPDRREDYEKIVAVAPPGRP